MIDAVPQGSRELQVAAEEPPVEAIEDIAAFFDVSADMVTVSESSGTTPEATLTVDGEEVLAAPIQLLWEAVTTTAEVVQTEPTTDLDPLSLIDQVDTATFRSQSVPQLVVASRSVERRAERQGEGTLYACFQHLSRVERDLRTMLYYSVLAQTELDVHLFGVPDTDLENSEGLTVHETTSEELARTWLVAFDGNGDDDRKAALVAEEIGPREYRGFWTVQPERVDEVIGYLTATYLS